MFLTLPKGNRCAPSPTASGSTSKSCNVTPPSKTWTLQRSSSSASRCLTAFCAVSGGKQELTDAMSAQSGKRSGMNMWLALDIEQKRTRAAGGMKHKMRESDGEALAEAMASYLRFEAKSNELAADLFDDITLTISTETRAHAFAGLGCSQAQRHLIFGMPANPCRLSALSSAKAAQLADPKLATGHIAMALALQIGATPSEFQEARDELVRACELDARVGRLPSRAGAPRAAGRRS